jgi:hypothetical protein
LFVVPFQESRSNLGFCESRQGKLVAEALKNWVRDNADDPVLVEGERANEVLEEILERLLPDRLGVKDWRQVAGGLGARYLLEGDIRSAETRDPKFVGVYRGRAIVDYRVIDLDRGEIGYEHSALEVTYPEGSEELSFPTGLGMGQEEGHVRAKLLRKLGEEIAKELYGYSE